jgi:succinoglycan biosynthesis protein ExoU
LSTEGASVCVIIAAFDAQATVARAVKSALCQEHVREVVVVDDASRDATAHVARLQDDGSGRLSVITLSENRGPAGARNVALDIAQSPLVCVLDADDYFLPRRIARLFESSRGDWDMLADDIIILPEGSDEGMAAPLCEAAPTERGLLDLETLVLGNIGQPDRHRRELGFLKPLMKRSFLDRHGLRYDDRLRLGEDYALYTRALIAGARFRIVSACGYVAVERKASISAHHSGADLQNLVGFDEEVLSEGSLLSAAERAAVARHRTATLRKAHHRAVLDSKRKRGHLAALISLLHMPSAVPYILKETLRANFASQLGAYAPLQQGGPRLLIGAPESGDDPLHSFAERHRQREDAPRRS